MFGKLLCFAFLALFSGACYIATGNVSTIVCDNTENSCYLRTENKVLKTSNKTNTIKINRNLQNRITKILPADKKVVSKNLITNEETTSEERQNAFTDMIKLALEMA